MARMSFSNPGAEAAPLLLSIASASHASYSDAQRSSAPEPSRNDRAWTSRLHGAPEPGAARKRLARRISFQSFRGVLPLFVVIFAVSVAGLVGIGAVIVAARELISYERSMAVGLSALELERDSLSRSLKSLTWWDDAVAHLVKKLDVGWADSTFGSHESEINGTSASFLLDGQDRTVLSFIAGRLAWADAFEELSGGLRTLLDQARSAPLAVPAPAMGYLLLDGKPQLVGVSAITPEQHSPAWPENVPRSLVVLARPVDKAFLDRLARKFELASLHVLRPGETPLEATLPLTTPEGRTIATLTWDSDPHGWGPLRLILPGTAVLVIAMSGLFWVVLRRAHGVGEALFEQARIIDQIHDAIVSIDTAGRVTRWNTGAEKMLGWSRAEALGRPVESLGLREVFNRFEPAPRLMSGEPKHMDLEASVKKRNQEVFQARFSLSELTDPRGEFIGVISYALDITEQKRLEARLEEMATVDPLTKASTRRFLLDHGTPELLRARRYRRPLSCLFLDLDHFKRVNDRLGHQAGDLVLAGFAKLCREALRGPDVLCRYGGEEFVALLPETTLEEAVRVAQRVSERVRQMVFPLQPPVGRITVSVGVTALQDSDADLQSVIDRADRAMYQAKERGRDRVETIP